MHQSTSSVVIGHRGASGYRPENTLAAFELAIRMGADRVETDVVPTRDGVLVLRHESELSVSTDVATRGAFAGAATERDVDGVPKRGWFTEDLTSSQVRTLRAREAFPSLRQANTLYDGLYQVPTLGELLGLAENLRRELRRDIVVSVEVKQPARFARAGLDMVALMAEQVRAAGLNRPDAPLAIQCFEAHYLPALRTAGVEVALVQLVDDDDAGRSLCDEHGLAAIAQWASILAPHRSLVLGLDEGGRLAEPSPLVDLAHAAGLDVHVWTLRNENAWLPPASRIGDNPASWGSALGEHLAFLRAGVDGVFTDHPDTGVEARRLFERGRRTAIV